MTGFLAVFKRELKGCFGTPVAYVFLVIFLAVSFYWALFGSQMYEAGEASLAVFFNKLPKLFVLFAPALAMRAWAEERRTGTIEHLFSLPLTVPQAVLGKFAAAWAFFAVALLLTFSLPVTAAFLGDPDWGAMVCGYGGAFLLAASYLAISSFFSALTKNQVIAFILGAVACALFVAAGLPSIRGIFAKIGLAGFLEAVNFLNHYDGLQRGVVELRTVFYLLALPAAFLAATCFVLEDRKAR